MKLHLPKSLRSALLATFAVVAFSSSAYAGWSPDDSKQEQGSITYYLAPNDSGSAINKQDAINAAPNDPQLPYTKVVISAGREGAGTQDATLSSVTIAAADTLAVSRNPWVADNTGNSIIRDFDKLTIEELVIGDGTGAAAVDIGSNQVVQVNAVSGTLSSVNVDGNLTFSSSEAGSYEMGSVTVGASGRLSLVAGAFSVGETIQNSGTVVINEGSNDVFLYTLVGKDHGKYKPSVISNTSTGNLVIENTGNKKLDGAVTIANGGTVTLRGGTFGTTEARLSNTIKTENATFLGFEDISVNIGGNASSNQMVDADIIVGNGATLTMTVGDRYHYANKHTLKVLSGGSVVLGDTRQTLAQGFIVELAGGTITGVGDSAGMALDFYNGGTIKVTENSTLDANTGGHDNDATITLDVANGKTLTMNGNFVKTAITVSNEGIVVYKGEVFAKDLAIDNDEGVFEYNFTGERTHTGNITGAGTLRKSDSGELKLSGTVGTDSAALGKLEVNDAAGKVTLSNTAYVAATSGSGVLNIAEDTTTISATISGTYAVLNTVVGEGATLRFANTNDLISHGTEDMSITVNGGTLDLGNGRQTLGNRFHLTLNDGKVIGTNLYTGSNGGNPPDGYGALDFKDNVTGTVTSTGISSITGGLRLRSDITIDVQDGTLTVDAITKNKGITKKGAGTLVLTMANTYREELYTGNTIMENGAIKYDIEGTYSYAGTITGSGDIIKAGTGSITIAAVDSLDGDITVSGGNMTITNLTLANTMEVTEDGGSLSVTNIAFADNIVLEQYGDAVTSYYSTDGTKAGQSANGFLTHDGTYYLFKGKEWAGAIGDYTIDTTTSAGNTLITLTHASSDYYVNEGVVNFAGDNATAGTAQADTFVIKSGATLQLNGDVASAITVRGDGTLALVSGTSAMPANVRGISDTENWTGVVRISNVQVGNFNPTGYANANSGLELVGVYGWLSNGFNMAGLLKLTKEGELNGFKVTAASNWTHTFSGAVAGNGDFTINNGGAGSPTYNFTGDLSEWQGAFKVENTNANKKVTLNLTGGGNLFADASAGVYMNQQVAGTFNLNIGKAGENTNMRGAVVNEGAGTLNVTVQGNTTFKAAVDVSRMTLNSGVTVTLENSASAMGMLDAANGSIHIANGGTLTLGTADTATISTIGTVTTTTNGTIHLNKAATLNAFTKGEGSGTITLTGSGLYDMGSATTVNVLGLTNADNWTGTVKISGNESVTNLNFANYGNENSWVQLIGLKGHWHAGSDNAVNISTNIILGNETGESVDAFTHNNGYSNTVYTISGDVKGTGNLKTIRNQSNATVRTVFTGDVSGWTGSYINANNTSELQFAGDAKDINAAITKTGGKINLTVDTDEAATFSKDVTVSKLTLNQQATFNNTLSVDKATIQAKDTTVGGAELKGVVIDSAGIHGTNTAVVASEGSTAGGSVSNALIELRNAASYSIEDTQLNNVVLNAGAKAAIVELQNVGGNAVLQSGTYKMQAIFGSAVEQMSTAGNPTLQYEIAGNWTVGDNATTIVLTADPETDCGQFRDEYNLVFTLNLDFADGVTAPATVEGWKDIVNFGGEMATLLAEQNAQYTMTVEEAMGMENPYVIYNYDATSSVLTVTVNGLTVPEPTTATLSLLALAALAARRRRR